MSRIVPFELPSVAGGSQGGYTPGPTPTPSVTPYNFSLMSISTTFGKYAPIAGWVNYDIGAKLTITGVTVNDDSQVSSVVVGYTMTAGTAEGWQAGDSPSPEDTITINAISSATDITNVFGTDMSDYLIFSAGIRYNGSEMYSDITNITSTFAITSIKVYDADGNVLQEWEP